MKESPYLTIAATMWCIAKGVVIVGYDFYHGNDEPGAPRMFHNSRTLSEHGVITMPYLNNLDQIESDRFTLVGLALKLIGAKAFPMAILAYSTRIKCRMPDRPQVGLSWFPIREISTYPQRSRGPRAHEPPVDRRCL